MNLILVVNVECPGDNDKLIGTLNIGCQWEVSWEWKGKTKEGEVTN